MDFVEASIASDGSSFGKFNILMALEVQQATIVECIVHGGKWTQINASSEMETEFLEQLYIFAHAIEVSHHLNSWQDDRFPLFCKGSFCLSFAMFTCRCSSCFLNGYGTFALLSFPF